MPKKHAEAYKYHEKMYFEARLTEEEKNGFNYFAFASTSGAETSATHVRHRIATKQSQQKRSDL